MAANGPKYVAEQLSLFSESDGDASEVQLSHELVGLLSDQLYQSPLKAIEELVVNAYDADATECRLHVPDPSHAGAVDAYIAVFDSGIGMDRAGLIDLWHIGHSRKRDQDMEARLKRKSIGKFGIGKLATYSVGRRLTYLSKTKDSGILGVTVDFRSFDTATRGTPVKVPLPIRRLAKWADLQKTALFKRVLDSLELNDSLKGPHWTLVIIEDLKPKAADIRMGNLKWVLSTALPMGAGFHVYLNKKQIQSSKEKAKKSVEFNVSDLPSARLDNLQNKTGQTWTVDDDKLVSKEFPSGISAHVIVTDVSLYGQKSDDVMRSHGFFIKVRGRLINQLDPYFGVFPKTYELWNNFRAVVHADDLDALVMSSREQIEDSVRRAQLQELLHELFNEARTRYKVVKDKEAAAQATKKEDERDYVGARLVEQPMADALALPLTGDESDDEWFYLRIDPGADRGSIVEKLYNQPRGRYSYAYERLGKESRLFRFSPAESKFEINDQHEFVEEHSEDPRSRVLLEDVVTAEVMLEIYLRRSGVRGHVIADVLNGRDTLLRSLAKERRFSLAAIGASLRDAAANEHDLEIGVVYATRALGFVSRHVSGSGEPDGVATFIDYPDGEKRITLEAKSSASTPSLGAIDVAGLESHMTAHHAQGCLVVAPSYPGDSKEESELASRAKAAKVSCWTIEQLATVVESAEARHLNAKTVLDVVLNQFAPKDVTRKLDDILKTPSWKQQDLYRAIVAALRDLEETAPDAVRNVSMLVGRLASDPAIKAIKQQDVADAVAQLASASKGAMTYRPNGQIALHVTWDELDRRVSALTGLVGAPRKPGRFHK